MLTRLPPCACLKLLLWVLSRWKPREDNGKGTAKEKARHDNLKLHIFPTFSATCCNSLRLFFRKWAEYGFGEYRFKHLTQWVFRPSPSSGERAQWVPLSLLFVCQSKLTEFSQSSPSLPYNLMTLSKFSSPKQYSRNSIPPVSYSSIGRNRHESS